MIHCMLISSVQPHVNVSNSKATLTLYRDRGTFGTISALWVCTTAGANGSISPISGEAVFLDGQRLANFTVSAVDNGVSCGCVPLYGCVVGVAVCHYMAAWWVWLCATIWLRGGCGCVPLYGCMVGVVCMNWYP